MKKTTLELIIGITSGISTIASTVVTYTKPTYAPQIVAVIGIVNAAIIEGCSLFVKTEEKKSKQK